MLSHAYQRCRLGPTWKLRCEKARRHGGFGVRRGRTLAQPVCALTPNDPRDASSSGDREPHKRAPHPELEDIGAGNRSSSSSIPDALPYLGSESDWREFRAQLVSQARGLPSAAAAAGEEWAHAVPRPERGALLLAHPQLFQTSQTYFHRAAILVMEHGPQGSYGLILNRPSPLLLRDVQLSRPQPQFGECRVYMGGDVGQGEVQILHPHGHLSGAVEVVKGVYAGGMEAARQAVDAGSVQAGDFRWFNAYAGWAPGQLEAECRRGVWFPAAASPRLLLEPVAPGQGAAYWHRVMQMMGGHHETLSRVVQKHEQRADTP